MARVTWLGYSPLPSSQAGPGQGVPSPLHPPPPQANLSSLGRSKTGCNPSHPHQTEPGQGMPFLPTPVNRITHKDENISILVLPTWSVKVRSSLSK